MPVGMCVSRTADEVLLTCWPPAPGGAEDVHLDVFLPEVDLDGVVDVGIDEHRGERGVPPGLGIVGRDPDQPVHALLRLEVAVGVLALDLDR